jgi:hypothetical protein
MVMQQKENFVGPYFMICLWSVLGVFGRRGMIISSIIKFPLWRIGSSF